MILALLLIMMPVPFIVLGVFKKRNRARDSWVVFLIIGILIIVTMFLAASHYGRTSLFDRDIKLYSFNIGINYYSEEIEFKVPAGIGLFYIATGVLMLVLVKKPKAVEKTDL